jgi:ribosomal protein L11 methylase PrmA
LDGIFSAGVDYAGKSILDVGCNMGVVAYEISKLGPNSIHGIDILRPHIETARMIFLGSPVESRFDCLNLGSRRLGQILRSQYDIVMLLAVYHHMQDSLGPDKARRVLADIARRAQTIVARVPPNKDSELIDVLSENGFSVKSAHISPLGSHVIALERPIERSATLR